MIVLRAERDDDASGIREVIAAAFAGQPHSSGDEPALVGRLRERGELVLSLVAEQSRDRIAGHVGFSPVSVDGRETGWYQLAPVAIAPALQGCGIGSALIARGLDDMRARGAAGIGVVGNPAYYERFGFAKAVGFGPEGHDADYFRALTFGGSRPIGPWRYASAFYG